MEKFKLGDLVQWENSDWELCIDVIRESKSSGKLFFWNVYFDLSDYQGLKKLDVSVPYFDDDMVFADV